MTDRTISEQLFESLCSAKAVSCRRIPAGPSKTPDYEIVLDVQRVAVEVKQLDENDEDKRLNRVLDQRLMIEGAVAPTSRLRKQIAEGYRQLKAVAREGRPSLLVVYNNAGVLNYIDSFTVTTAMFGTFGVHLGLSASSGMQVTGQGFMGKRKITRNTCRQLSALAVMSGAARGAIRLDIYHNPYAITPIRPAVIASLKLYKNPVSTRKSPSEWRDLHRAIRHFSNRISVAPWCRRRHSGQPFPGLLRIPVMRQLLDVMHQAEELPLRIDLPLPA